MKFNNDKLDKIYDFLKKNKDYSYNSLMIKLLKNNKFSSFDDDFLEDTLTYIIDNDLEPTSSINEAEKLYNIIVFDKNDKEQYSLYLKLLPLYHENNNIINIKDFQVLYYLFQDKKLVLGLYSVISEYKNFDLLKKWYNYIIEARRFYIDEQAFYSSIINTLKTLPKTDIDYYIDKRLKEDREMSGIYNVDEDKIKNLQNDIECLKEESIEIEKKLKDADILTKSFIDSIDEKIRYTDNKSKIILNELRDYAFGIEEGIRRLKSDSSILSNNDITKSETKLDILIEELQKYNNSKNITQIVEEKENDNLDEIFSFDIPAKQELSLIKRVIDKEHLQITKDTKKIDDEIIFEISKLLKVNNKTSLSDEDRCIYVFYYWALYNDNLDFYHYMSSNVNFYREGYKLLVFLNKEVTNKFSKDVYISLFLNKRNMLYDFIIYKKIDLLIELLKINPSFEITFSIDKLDEVVDMFGINEIAKCNDILFHNLGLLETSQFSYYKKIYNINPNFKIYRSNIIYENEIYTCEEMANLNLEQQKIIWILINNDIFDRNYINNSNLIQYKDNIRNITNIIYNSDNKDDIYISDEIIKLDYEFFSKKYINLDRESQRSIIRSFNNDSPLKFKRKIKKITKSNKY